jgi:hypothetical protein
MSAAAAMTDGGVAPDAEVRVIRAMAEALLVLEQAQQHVEDGTIDTAIYWHIGQTVMLADQAVLLAEQVGRSPLL